MFSRVLAAGAASTAPARLLFQRSLSSSSLCGSAVPLSLSCSSSCGPCCCCVACSAVGLSQVFRRSLHGSSAALSGPALVQHKSSVGNTGNEQWDFTAENHEKIERIMGKFPANYKQSGIMPLLQLAQEQNDNWLPLSAMNRIASMLAVPPIRVYEVATFYSMFNRTPMGKYHLQVCGTTPCQLCGAEKIIETLEHTLKIKCGESTADGVFTLSEVECLGACVNAPMLQVNNHEYYENLTAESTVQLLAHLRDGKAKVGPQTSQRNCEGPMGKTSLFTDIDPAVHRRDIDSLVRQVKEEQQKAAAAAKK